MRHPALHTGLRVAVAAAIALAALELLSRPIYHGITGRRLTGEDLAARAPGSPPEGRKAPASDRSDGSPSYMRGHVLHPYLGFVRNRDASSHLFNGRPVVLPVNEYGFFGDPPPPAASPRPFTIALTGGSAALDLFLRSRAVLAAELERRDGFEGGRVRIISLALGGMKQPQQLMALDFFLAAGRSFDAVVNLDGFNEIALPLSENIPLGVSPLFPRSWRSYAAKAFDPEETVAVAEIEETRSEIERWRRRLSRSFLRRSGLVRILWRAWSKREERRWRAEEAALRARMEGKKPGYQVRGPSYRPGSEGEILADCARLWKESSLQMWKICRENGIAYYHFLQPNQHLAGSKRLTDWEKRFALAAPRFPHRRSVEEGYPLLRAAGEELARTGVPFGDLTGLFSGVNGTVYEDACCHYNQVGNDLLAEGIADWIARRRAAR